MHRVDIDLVRRIIPQFHEFLEKEGRKWKEERDQKDKFFSTV